MRFVQIILLVLIQALPLHAQDNKPEPLLVPFARFPPFQYFDEAGERQGFIVQLSILIGEEIGVPIDFLDVAGAREWVAAQASGQTQMIPGVLQLPPLAASNVFSDVVASDVLRPAVQSNDLALIETGTLDQKRVGIVPPAVGSNEPILKQNIPVGFDSPQAALIDLLSGKVDAVLLPPPVIYQMAREAGVDGRIAFIGAPLKESARHVALHQSRAALLGPINEALARLEADGRLEALRQRFNISVPPPPPEILQIGIAHLPPMSIVDADDRFSGFNVEVTQAVAARASLDIEFVPLPVADWVKGPLANGLDAVSALVITEDRRGIMDFSYPVLKRNVGLVVGASSDLSVSQIADLSGLRVGTIERSVFANRASSLGTVDVIGFRTNADLIAAQLAGEIDAAIIPPNVARREIDNARAQDELRMVILEGETIDTAIALRPGLGVVRERLNTVLPGYLLSDDYAALRQKYFGEPIFWTAQRLYAALGAVAAVFLALLGLMIWQAYRRRQQEFARKEAELVREQAFSDKLGRMVVDLERSNRELDEFAYIASHDLKEPLRGIGINANFLLRENLNGKVAERIVRMSELAKRMEQLISDLLYFSRLDRGDAARVTVQPNQVIDAIRSDLAEWLAERGGKIIEVGAIPSLRAERVKVKTVLQNLIVNGIKYSDATIKRVEVGFTRVAEVNGQTLENAIFVKDNGIGIGEEYHNKIFRIFSRLNKEADYGSGTGSGLAFVRKIVEEHGGVVDFTSTPGEGSTFYVTLPLAARSTEKQTDRVRMQS